MNEYYDADNNFIGVNREFITVNKGDVHEIVKHYGAPKQKNKAVEELLELSEVLIKDVNKNDNNLDGIYEEMADVYIMLEQLVDIYDIDLELLQQEVNRKIDRTFRRMKHILDPDCGWR